MRAWRRFHWGLFAALLVSLSASAQGWYGAGWSTRERLTVPHSQVVSAPQVNFPLYVDLQTLGPDFFSGVKLDGSDVVVTAADGVTLLPREVVGLSTASQSGSLWFKAPSLDLAVDATFFVYWGNPAATVTNDSTTWAPEYAGVWHLDDAPGTVTDATGQSDGGIVTVSSPGQIVQAQPGQLDLADFFVGQDPYAPGYSITVPYEPALDLSSDAGTVTAWVYIDRSATYDACGNGAEVGLLDKYGFANPAAASQYELLMQGRRVKGCVGILANWDCATGATCMAAGEWHHLAMTWDDTTIAVYLDGAHDGTYTPRRVGMLTGAMPFKIGNRSRGQTGPGGYWFGSIDEVHLVHATRSPEWLRAEYLSQHLSYRFVATGPVQTMDGGVAPVLRWVEAAPAKVKNGDVVTLDLWADSTGHTVLLDATALDSTPTSPVVTDQGDGTYRVAYTVSGTNTRADGTHPLPVTVRNLSGRVAQNAQASVELDNTPPVVTDAFAAPTRIFNGMTLTVSVSTDSAGYRVTGDFSAIDDTYLAGAEAVTETGDGGYLVQYTIGTLDTRPDGTYFLPVSVSDGPNTVINSQAHTELGFGGGGPAINAVAVSPLSVRNGDMIDVHVATNGVGYTVTGAFFNVDSSYQSGTEQVTDNGDSTYDVRYAVSTANTRANGLSLIPLTVADSAGRSAIAQGQVTLANVVDAGEVDAGAVDAGAALSISGEPEAATVCGRLWSYGPQPSAVGQLSWELDGPEGSAIDSSTGLVTWSPTHSQAGTQHFALRARSAAGEEAAQAFDVVVDCEPRRLTLRCGCDGTPGGWWAFALALLAFARARRSQRTRQTHCWRQSGASAGPDATNRWGRRAAQRADDGLHAASS